MIWSREPCFLIPDTKVRQIFGFANFLKRFFRNFLRVAIKVLIINYKNFHVNRNTPKYVIIKSFYYVDIQGIVAR